jgi:hypothetical protein
LDEADDNAFDSPLINLAEAAILMQALPNTPQIREIQRLTRDALRQMGKQNPAPSVSHNRRTPAKQKGHQEANQGDNPRGQPWPRYQDESYHAGLGIQMTHGTSSTPIVTVDLLMKPTVSRPSART